MKKLILAGALAGTLLVGCVTWDTPEQHKAGLIAELDQTLRWYSKGERTTGQVVGSCLSLYLNFPETKNVVCDEFIKDYTD